MNEEYLNEIKQMGEEIEAVVKKVIKLETLHGSRIDNLEDRNKKVERELNAMIVKYYEEDAASDSEHAAWNE